MVPLTETEKELFKVKFSIANKNHINVYSWIYYDENNDLCSLTNDRGNIIIKNKTIDVNKWYKNIIDKRYSMNIKLDEKELAYIKKSEELTKKTFELTEYINNEIGDYTGRTSYEIIWFHKKVKSENCSENYLKITIDIQKYQIRVFNYNENKDIITTPKNLKAFLKLNKSKILKIIQENKKLYTVKMERYQKTNKKIKEEQKLKEYIELEKHFYPNGSSILRPKVFETKINEHDATRKVGSRVKSSSIYIKKSLKERYEIQAQKPFPVKYPWESLDIRSNK